MTGSVSCISVLTRTGSSHEGTEVNKGATLSYKLCLLFNVGASFITSGYLWSVNYKLRSGFHFALGLTNQSMAQLFWGASNKVFGII